MSYLPKYAPFIQEPLKCLMSMPVILPVYETASSLFCKSHSDFIKKLQLYDGGKSETASILAYVCFTPRVSNMGHGLQGYFVQLPMLFGNFQIINIYII